MNGRQRNHLRFFMGALLVFLALAQPFACAQKSKAKKMPKEEPDELMNDILPFAQKMLSEHGEFFPYGGAITSRGEIVHVGASDGDDNPSPQKLIDDLIGSFQAQAKAGAYRATAIVIDVSVKSPPSAEKTDAIQISLDHAGGLSVDYFLPYQIKDKGKVVYGEMFAQKGQAKIFKQPQRQSKSNVSWLSLRRQLGTNGLHSEQRQTAGFLRRVAIRLVQLLFVS